MSLYFWFNEDTRLKTSWSYSYDKVEEEEEEEGEEEELGGVGRESGGCKEAEKQWSKVNVVVVVVGGGGMRGFSWQIDLRRPCQ